MNIYKKFWMTVFEGDEETALVTELETDLGKISDQNSPEYKRTNKLLTAAKVSLDIKAGKYLPQDKVNALLADDKRKHQDAHRKTLEELQVLQKKASLSSEERAELEKRIADTTKNLQTKEETAQQEREKLIKNHKKEIELVSTEKETWKNRFTKSTIETSIISAAAASTPKAVNPDQILVILQPKTRLVEELDGEGKPTGNLIPKISFADKDGKGKPVVLDLSPSEAVKRMSQMEEHFNLFQSDGERGFGKFRAAKGKDINIKDLAKDAEAYRAARKSGEIKY
jgi:hypothetical protein